MPDDGTASPARSPDWAVRWAVEVAEQSYMECTGKPGDVLTEDWAHACIVRPN